MENKEILTLIERGFKPETISSEFNIPYVQIQEALLEKERNASKCETEMDKMRKKYFDYIIVPICAIVCFIMCLKDQNNKIALMNHHIHKSANRDNNPM